MNEAHPSIDQLNTSALLVKILTAFTVATLILVMLDATFRPACRERSDAALFSALGMSAPAIFPTGRGERSPETADARVDLRFTPFWPLPDPDPAGMIFPEGH